MFTTIEVFDRELLKGKAVYLEGEDTKGRRYDGFYIITAVRHVELEVTGSSTNLRTIGIDDFKSGILKMDILVKPGGDNQ